jgi:hypothetical protein
MCGASLATALHAVDANGAVVVFGNSSREMTSISFADFRGEQNARLQSFFSFTSGPEEQFAPDLCSGADRIGHLIERGHDSVAGVLHLAPCMYG